MKVLLKCAGIGTGILLVLALPAPIHAQEVGWSDLVGAEVEASVHRTQRMRRRGRTATVRTHQIWKYSIDADKAIDFRVETTIRGPRGTRKDKPRGGVFALNEPRRVRSRGGGEAVWTFDDGTLTFLRTFPSGAIRVHFAFARRQSKLVCKVSQAFARQDGNKPIQLISPSGHRVTLISARQVSSDCDVQKRK